MITHDLAGQRTAPRAVKLSRAAELLDCSRRYLDWLIKSGRIRAIRLEPTSAKSARITVSEIERYLGACSPHGVGAA